MQELLFPFTSSYDDGFDDFELEKVNLEGGRYVVMFRKQANNGKYIYLVGDRYRLSNEHFTTENVLEFKHARDRAEQEYKERVDAASR